VAPYRILALVLATKLLHLYQHLHAIVRRIFAIAMAGVPVDKENPLKPRTVEFRKLLQVLSREMVAEQLPLDQQYALRLRDFLPILRLGIETGNTALACSLVPPALTVQDIKISLECHLSETVGREVSLGVQLINLGFERRFSRSRYLRSTLNIHLKQTPLLQQKTFLKT
jgi:hypothetical protein